MYPSVQSDTAYKIIDKEGDRRYELANHLGNVLAVISDRKTGVGNGASYTSFEAITISATDYYPFGMSMPGRSFTAANTEGYRYSFNGKEDDTEWAKQDYGMRIYDKRIGKFLSVDPLSKQYPELTPYQFASNTPIIGIDLDGLELAPSTDKQQARIAPLITIAPSPEPAPINIPRAPAPANPPGSIGNLILEGLSYLGKGAFLTVALVIAPPFDQMKTRREFPDNYYSQDPYQKGREKKRDKYVEKRTKMEKDDEKPHILYKLVAKEDGIYPCPSCPSEDGGSIYLKTGETWKYGITSANSVKERYKGKKTLEATGTLTSTLTLFRPVTLDTGSESQMKIREKILTVAYPVHPENIARAKRESKKPLYRPPGQVKDK